MDQFCPTGLLKMVKYPVLEGKRLSHDGVVIKFEKSDEEKFEFRPKCFDSTRCQCYKTFSFVTVDEA